MSFAEPSNPTIARDPILERILTAILYQCGNFDLQLKPNQGEASVRHFMQVSYQLPFLYYCENKRFTPLSSQRNTMHMGLQSTDRNLVEVSST
jgi:hypothetical protein